MRWNGNILTKDFTSTGRTVHYQMTRHDSPHRQHYARVYLTDAFYLFIQTTLRCVVISPKTLPCTVKIPQHRRSLCSQSAHLCPDDVIWRSSASASAVFFPPLSSVIWVIIIPVNRPMCNPIADCPGSVDIKAPVALFYFANWQFSSCLFGAADLRKKTQSNVAWLQVKQW